MGASVAVGVRVLQDVPETIDDVCGVRVDLQQHAAMNSDWKEAGDSRETGVLGTQESEDKRLQLSQDHSEFSGVVIVQREVVLVVVVCRRL